MEFSKEEMQGGGGPSRSSFTCLPVMFIYKENAKTLTLKYVCSQNNGF